MIMSYYTQKSYYIHEEMEDLRQVAEGEVVSGPKSVQALPGGIALGEGAQLTISDAGAESTLSKVMESNESLVGKLLGLQSQMAQGIFEMAPAIAAETAAAQQGMFTASLSELGTGLEQIGSRLDEGTKESSKLIIYAIAGFGLLFLLKRK